MKAVANSPKAEGGLQEQKKEVERLGMKQERIKGKGVVFA